MDYLSSTDVDAHQEDEKFEKIVGDDHEDDVNLQEEVKVEHDEDINADNENLDQVEKIETGNNDPNNEEYTKENYTLDLDNQPSDETDNNDSTVNPIAPNSEGDNESSDAKELATEQKDGPPDALKDDKKQREDDQASDTLMETKPGVEETQKTASDEYNNNNNNAAAARQSPQQKPLGLGQQQSQGKPQQKPQGPGQQQSQGKPQKKPRGPGQQESQGKPQQNPQGPGQQQSQGKPQQKPQGLGQQESQEEQQPKESGPTPQPQQKAQQLQPLPQQKESASSTQTQEQPQVNKAQAKQQPQQDSISPPKEPQVNHETVAPQKTQPLPLPQPQPETQTQARSIPSGGVVPPTPTPETDAANLYRAFKGSECDVGRIVQILSKHDPKHRHQIAQHYRKSYGEELSDCICSELSTPGKGFIKEKVGLDFSIKATGSLGWLCKDIKRAISLWLLEESERDATIVWQSLQLMSFDKAALTEVICSRTPSQIRSLKRAYFTHFKSELSKDISSSTLRINSNTKELLVACLDDKARDEETNVDVKKAEEDATQLYKDGEKIWGTNNKTFIDIFTKRNRPHLAAVDAAYDKLYGHSLEEAVRKETSRTFLAGLLTLLKCAKNPAKYFAEVLYNSMKGLGTSDTTLIRVVVTRAGTDMEDIKKEYVQAYKTSLKDYIHDDTSGAYRTFLLNLLE